jgi:hypothetical protein
MDRIADARGFSRISASLSMALFFGGVGGAVRKVSS